jgi:hypothetical protein
VPELSTDLEVVAEKSRAKRFSTAQQVRSV